MSNTLKKIFSNKTKKKRSSPGIEMQEIPYLKRLGKRTSSKKRTTSKKTTTTSIPMSAVTPVAASSNGPGRRFRRLLPTNLPTAACNGSP